MSEEVISTKKTTKKGLGRGLGSLLGEVAESPIDLPVQEIKKAASVTRSNMTNALSEAPRGSTQVPDNVSIHERIWKVGIEKIYANKEQPRKLFDQQKLAELAASIKEKGILQPIVVKKTTDGKFEIIAGERRWRASQLAGMQEVPVIIKAAESREILELALIENIQRQDLNPIEEGEAYCLLADKYGLTQQQIADKVSKDRSTVANLMRINSLTAEVKKMVRTGELQLGQAKVLLSVNDPAQQALLARVIVKKKLSVRATEKLVQRSKDGQDKELDVDDLNHIKIRDIKPLISELQSLFGTKVEIDTHQQRSKVSFHFYSLPELNQFVEKLRKTKT